MQVPLIEPNCAAFGVEPACNFCKGGGTYQCNIAFYKLYILIAIESGTIDSFLKKNAYSVWISKTIELLFPEYIPRLNAILLLG
jgi:hypothetical protein